MLSECRGESCRGCVLGGGSSIRQGGIRGDDGDGVGAAETRGVHMVPEEVQIPSGNRSAPKRRVILSLNGEVSPA